MRSDIMAYFKEIVTKAIIGKGKKTTNLEPILLSAKKPVSQISFLILEFNAFLQLL